MIGLIEECLIIFYDLIVQIDTADFVVDELTTSLILLIFSAAVAYRLAVSL